MIDHRILSASGRHPSHRVFADGMKPPFAVGDDVGAVGQHDVGAVCASGQSSVHRRKVGGPTAMRGIPLSAQQRFIKREAEGIYPRIVGTHRIPGRWGPKRWGFQYRFTGDGGGFRSCSSSKISYSNLIALLNCLRWGILTSHWQVGLFCLTSLRAQPCWFKPRSRDLPACRMPRLARQPNPLKG